MATETNTTVHLIDKLFQRLDEWRHLPAYQLERRADIFFSLYLNDIIKTKFQQDIDFIIPEFPIRIGSIYPNNVDNPNRSFKIDYVAICNPTLKTFFIELKTDATSLREKQNKYLQKAKKINVKKLVDGVLQIYKASSFKRKYDNLISLLSKIGWINKSTMTNTSQDYDIEIVFIQPMNNGRDGNIISFDEIISVLRNKTDELSIRFIKSLESWKRNPNNNL